MTRARVWAFAPAIAALLACSKESPAERDNPSVKRLVLPKEDVVMPDGPGKKEFAAVCSACHSPRYVTNQPPLSKDGWVKVVDKMKKNYGAPVPDNLSPKVIEYLVAIHGPK